MKSSIFALLIVFVLSGCSQTNKQSSAGTDNSTHEFTGEVPVADSMISKPSFIAASEQDGFSVYHNNTHKYLIHFPSDSNIDSNSKDLDTGLFFADSKGNNYSVSCNSDSWDKTLPSGKDQLLFEDGGVGGKVVSETHFIDVDNINMRQVRESFLNIDDSSNYYRTVEQRFLFDDDIRCSVKMSIVADSQVSIDIERDTLFEQIVDSFSRLLDDQRLLENTNLQQLSIKGKVLANSESWRTYINSNYNFALRYPPDLFPVIEEFSEESPSEVLYMGKQEIGAPNLKVSHFEKTLEECVNKDRAFVEDQYEQPSNSEREREYAFDKLTVNDFPAIFHKRNFGSMIGNVFDMYIETPSGTCLRFSSESDHTILESLYRSVKFTDQKYTNATYDLEATIPDGWVEMNGRDQSASFSDGQTYAKDHPGANAIRINFEAVGGVGLESFITPEEKNITISGHAYVYTVYEGDPAKLSSIREAKNRSFHESIRMIIVRPDSEKEDFTHPEFTYGGDKEKSYLFDEMLETISF